MALQSISLLLIYLAIFSSVLSQFINPPANSAVIPNPVYYIGDTLDITWDTNLNSTDLTLWQYNNNSFLTLLGT